MDLTISDSAEPCRKPVPGQNKTTDKDGELGSQQSSGKLPTLGQVDGQNQNLRATSLQLSFEAHACAIATYILKALGCGIWLFREGKPELWFKRDTFCGSLRSAGLHHG